MGYYLLLSLFWCLSSSRFGWQKPFSLVSEFFRHAHVIFWARCYCHETTVIACAMHTSFCILLAGVSLDHISRSEVSGSKGKCIRHFARQCQIPLSSVYLYQQCMRVPMFSYKLTNRVFCYFKKNFANLEGKKWCCSINLNFLHYLGRS